MNITIDIIDRVYKQIKEMCDYNNISVEKYIVDCVMDNFNILKYGDLNEKINPKEKEEKVEEKQKIEEKPKKRVGRPKKVKTEENSKEEPKEEPIVETKMTETFFGPLETLKMTTSGKVEDNVDTTDKQLQNKITRLTKRTLKTR